MTYAGVELKGMHKKKIYAYPPRRWTATSKREKSRFFMPDLAVLC
jgi:hypothetical protein